MAHEFGRRAFLEWVGKGSVVALSSFMLAGCEEEGTEQERTGPEEGTAQEERQQFPFSPNSAPPVPRDRFPDRTVDPQNLEEVLSTWRLKVGVCDQRKEKAYTFSQLVNLPRIDMNVDFHCVEGWSLHDIPWNGVHLSTLVADMDLNIDGYSHVTFHTIGGVYNESLPISVALEEKTLLAYGLGGYTMPLARGFPLRLVVPRLMAYKSAKYVDRILFTDQPLEGFWVQRGYPYDAPVPSDRLRKGKY